MHFWKIFLVVLLIASSSYANINSKEPETVISEVPKHSDEMYQSMSVTRIIDGDTFIANDDRIRLWGVDAPEKDHPHFNLSKVALQHFIGDKITCKHIDIDRYKRNVMQCLNNDGADIGALMVLTGMAKDFKRYSGGFYSSEQEWARENNLGVWKE